MKQLVTAAIFLLLVGIWVHPMLTDAGDTAARPPMPPAAATDHPSAVATAPAPAPAARPEAELKVLRGQPGYWRLGQDATGAWWFLSPDNHREFLNTVTTVQPFQKGRDADGPNYVSRDCQCTPDGTVGDIDSWAKLTLARLKDIGFKGIGAWSNPVFHKFDFPVTRDLNVWTWMPPTSKRFYTRDWAATAEHAIKVQVDLLRDSKSLVGYYIDNELDWGDAFSGPSAYFDHLTLDDPNRMEVLRVIQTVWPTPAAFSKDWNTPITEWSQLDKWDALPHEAAPAYARLFSAWLSHLSQDYFRLTTSLIHRYDPNHLILGVRFRGYAPMEVVRASRGYTDAQSLNYYVSDARLDLDLFKMMNDQSGQPIIISEYSFHALDGRSGDRNTVGFAAQVLDQQARADGYRLFTSRLARVPYVIGADWFQWCDEPPSGRNNDGEDVNFGIVDIDDNPYPLLVDAIRKTSPQLDPLHAQSAGDDQKDVWRESFATKPVAHIPYLTKLPTLNGELSDWPPEAKLQEVRHSQTVGLERSPLPLPNVYLGWRPEGLYMGMEVFDNDILGAPAKGWWWTRDHVEFWVSSRPVRPDQDAYDVYDTQFFFVPIDFPGEDGASGTVGQWHRPGDALADNLIPQPDVRQAVRILPDRYVVEMFIPAKALHGYDPATNPQLAFNIHVRNFQHAIDYFWSAPKEVLTQIRPGTWGAMYLDPPAKAEALAHPLPQPTNLR